MRRGPVALALATFAIAVCVRMPEVTIQSRFWAEEGKYFFRHALVVSPFDALTWSFGGYLNLMCNAATLLAARAAPLAFAPYLTMAVGLALMLLPALLLLRADDPFLASPVARIAALACLLLIPCSEEIWLQSLHGQVELALAAAILLALRARPPRRAALDLAVLFAAPLGGPTAIPLLPLFLLRAATERDRARLAQAVCLGAGVAIQLAASLHGLIGRGAPLDPTGLLLAVTVKHLALPLLGIARAGKIAAALHADLARRAVPVAALLLPCVFLPFAALAASHRAMRPAFWLLAGSGLLMGASYSGAIGGPRVLLDPHAGARYAFAPQALLDLACLAAASGAPVRLRPAFALLLTWLLAVGAWSYFRTWSYVDHGPAWRAQVARLRADPGRRDLAIWPDGWTLVLPTSPRR